MNQKIKTDHEDMPLKKIFLSCVIGVIIAFACALVLMLIVNIIAYRSGNPMKFRIAGYIIFILCAFVCGFLSAKRAGSKALICGLLSGAVYLAFIYSISLICTQEDMGIRRIVLLASAFAVCIIGAYAGLAGTGNKKVKRPENNAKKFKKYQK